MKPVATRPDKAPPPFQLAKGTRMHTVQGLWQDMQDGETAHEPAETLLQTALREGVEEIGLIEGKIMQLYDMGPVSFTSVKTSEIKWMWLFAAEMADENCLTPEVASTTAECAWLRLAEFESHGRDDHVPVVQSALKAIAAL